MYLLVGWVTTSTLTCLSPTGKSRHHTHFKLIWGSKKEVNCLTLDHTAPSEHQGSKVQPILTHHSEHYSGLLSARKTITIQIITESWGLFYHTRFKSLESKRFRTKVEKGSRSSNGSQTLLLAACSLSSRSAWLANRTSLLQKQRLRKSASEQKPVPWEQL